MKPYLIDTHAHVNFVVYKEDGNEVIKRALDKNIWLINIGSQSTTSARSVDIAEKYEQGVYASVGLHPLHLLDVKEKVKVGQEEIVFKTRQENYDKDFYAGLAQSDKVKAIGEIGLDYYRLPENLSKEQVKKNQIKVFAQQVELAYHLKLPMVLHCRQAHDDMAPLIKQWQKKGLLKYGGVMHCYGGTLEQAKYYIEQGLMISFTGVITFAKHQYDKMLAELPLEKIMVETDAPYLTPVPLRGQRNEPAYVEYVAEYIAQVRGQSLEEIAKATTENAMDFFKL